jgi:hypothetical protein
MINLPAQNRLLSNGIFEMVCGFHSLCWGTYFLENDLHAISPLVKPFFSSEDLTVVLPMALLVSGLIVLAVTFFGLQTPPVPDKKTVRKRILAIFLMIMLYCLVAVGSTVLHFSISPNSDVGPVLVSAYVSYMASFVGWAFGIKKLHLLSLLSLLLGVMTSVSGFGETIGVAVYFAVLALFLFLTGLVLWSRVRSMKEAQYV